MAADSQQGFKIDFRLIAAVVLLGVAALFTGRTIEGLQQRRDMRTELAEISHARYGLLKADNWVKILEPILDAKVDALDLNANPASLKPMVQNALNRLLTDVQEKMSKPAPPGPSGAPLGGMLGGGNPMIANMVVGALRPHVPEYSDVVLAELGKPETKTALKNYLKGMLAEGAKSTFANVDTKWYDYILKQYGCNDASACQGLIGKRIQDKDAEVAQYYVAVLGASALAFALLMIGRPLLRRASTVVLLLFCLTLLVGGVLTPMIEVEAKISHLGLTLLGTPVSFGDQVLYFQSKSVLEVFRVLVTTGRADMWIVGVLVLMFSIVFPILKLFASSFSLYKPSLLRTNPVVRFFALESSKWSMADVMALAIFMSFVAFNGLISNSMNGLKETGAQISIPTDSSKLLPGYALFIGFCLASLFLSKKLARGIETTPAE